MGCFMYRYYVVLGYTVTSEMNGKIRSTAQVVWRPSPPSNLGPTKRGIIYRTAVSGP